jgi:hypothetical protein
MTEYQGHRSRNAWNVALYINNEEPLYRLGVECRKAAKTVRGAARMFLRESGLEGQRTPDGAVYNLTCVKEALTDILD